jgi:hypothetical protein
MKINSDFSDLLCALNDAGVRYRRLEPDQIINFVRV